MKYKVGDKVYLRDDLKNNEMCGDFTWYNNMMKGMKATISKVNYSKSCYKMLEETVKEISYTDEMIDHEKTKEIQSTNLESQEESDNLETKLKHIKDELDEKNNYIDKQAEELYDQNQKIKEQGKYIKELTDRLVRTREELEENKIFIEGITVEDKDKFIENLNKNFADGIYISEKVVKDLNDYKALLEEPHEYFKKRKDNVKTVISGQDANEYFKERKDNVNHPDHYTQGEIETIDIIQHLTRDLKGIEAVCIGNVIKYVMRCNYKNGWEDVEKAKWYLDKFMEEIK